MRLFFLSLCFWPAVLYAAPSAAPQTAPALPRTLTEAFDAYTAMPDVLLPPLKAAQDKASAEAAAPQLKTALEALYDMRNKMQLVTEIPAEHKAAVEEKYAHRMRVQWGKVYEEIFRLQKEQCYDAPEFTKMFRVMMLMLGK